MADQTLLAKARKARFDDLPNFSGHPSEDVERFLKAIKNITKANDESENREILEIVRGKLIQSAGIWFDNNESNFNKWSDFEIAFRNRYFSTTIIQQKFDKLTQRKQQRGEAVTAYFDEIVNLCREIDPQMSDQIIIQHLMIGINPEFRKELCRRESSMKILKEFLHYAKIEQDLSDTFEQSRNLTIESSKPYYSMEHSTTPSLTTAINSSKSYYNNRKPNNYDTRSKPFQSSVYQRNSTPECGNRTGIIPNKQIWNNSIQPMSTKNFNNNISTLKQFSNCKICNRKNHRTIDCFHKHQSGCFKCGQDHMFRDCTTSQNFQ